MIGNEWSSGITPTASGDVVITIPLLGHFPAIIHTHILDNENGKIRKLSAFY